LVCKLCTQDKKLVQAHIIPRSFYAPLKEGGQIPQIITDKAGVYPQKSPTGVYDKEILCEECERVFAPWDDYGYRFLMGKISDDAYIRDRGEKIAYNMGPCDYHKLKLFFLSVLWRAGVSRQPMFNRVQLGPYAEKLRTRIRDADPGGVEDYAVALSRFDAPPGEVGILDPDRTEYEGVHHYRLYLGGYMAVIKATNKKPPAFLEGLYIAPGSDVLVLIREFRASKEFRAMVNVVKKASLQAKRGKS
jgi:hypothetical protein